MVLPVPDAEQAYAHDDKSGKPSKDFYNYLKSLDERVRNSALIPITNFGGKCDGVTDDTTAVKTSLAAQNYACLPPNTKTALGTPHNAGGIVMTKDQSLFGFGDNSIVVPINDFRDTSMIALDGDNINIRDFKIATTRTSASFANENFALIENYNLGHNSGAINNFRFSRVTVDMPNLLKGPLVIVGTGADITNIAVSGCNFINSAGGFTIFSDQNGAGTGTGADFDHTVSNVLFVDNIMIDTPLTTNVAAWWSAPMIGSLILLSAVGWLSYSAARAGQPLFGQVLED